MTILLAVTAIVHLVGVIRLGQVTCSEGVPDPSRHLSLGEFLHSIGNASLNRRLNQLANFIGNVTRFGQTDFSGMLCDM